ncbi:MAG TPA: hypothetical protein VJY15_05575 [Candidatus Acidoferrum sp.]|nr:hypothetical protein [Candidatus Acidoferrum sp.]
MMRANAVTMCLGILLAAAGASAQGNPPSQVVSSTQAVGAQTSPDFSAVHCAGFISGEKVPDEMRLISGEQSNIKNVFANRDYVYINKGSNQGVRLGDRFSAVRPAPNPLPVKWFKWQDQLLRAMGTIYSDTGQLVVVNVQPNVSTARVTFACNYLQRGDILRPMEEYPSPPYKPAEKFDRFAPVSGKSVGMLVMGQDFTQNFAQDSVVFVNLGANQGVKVGDYLRIFRYQGSRAETIPSTPDFQYKLLGFGSTPQKYEWNDLPREVLGEGIVIRVDHNSSTMFITYTSNATFAGDYVEIE